MFKFFLLILFFSVGVPFVGDTLELSANPNWAKIKAKQEQIIALNFVENVTKINRANVKVFQILLYWSLNICTDLEILNPLNTLFHNFQTWTPMRVPRSVV